MFSIPLDYGLYMAEKEGYLNTLESKKNRLFKEIQKLAIEGRVDRLTIDNRYLKKFGLTLNDLSERDVQKCKSIALTKRF
jgi:hypothetical protein